ncbi:MAG: RnfABCDGE type electron transport complex subunit D [Firmicutes bacterium]|nr:RnfABCDGE type electron transport complex subunit D [Bacillota bacterium]
MSIGVLYPSKAPHIRNPRTTSSIMREVLFALIPLVIFATVYFGVRVLLVVTLSVLSAVLSEFLFEFLLHRKITIGDCSAAVTGLIFALMLPVTVPWWIPVLGSVIAIIVMKQAFGGIGRNPFNPALFSRCLMMVVFPGIMRAFEIDAVSVPTPLIAMVDNVKLLPGLRSCFLGVIPGSIGETSSLLILLSGGYLIIRGIIDFRIPLVFLASSLILSYALGLDGLYQLFTGGIMFAAFFVATDPTTSPMLPAGKWIYGLLCGVLTILIRKYTGFPEGICFAVLCMNLSRYLLDRLLVPHVYGMK